MKKWIATVFLLLITTYATCASAYQWLSAGCGTLNFNSGHMSFNFTNSLSSDEKTAIKRGTDRVTLHSDSSITLVDNNDSSYSSGNGQNEVYKDPSHPTAYCSYWYNTGTCNVSEADMGFGDEPWVTADGYNTYNFGVSGRSMAGTAVHEGGHCVGMAHENRYYNMMGADFEHLTWDRGTAHYGPGENMSDGLIDLHGKRSPANTYRDVGVSIMRYSYASGEYSRHKYGVLRSTSDSILPVVGSFNGQPRYQVDAGQSVRMELTLENNGEQDSETPSLGFYLSTNAYISTADTYLRSGSPLLGRGLPFETYYTVTIPSATASGDYFLGAFIDDDDSITEYSGGWNNTTYYPIRVVATETILPDTTGVFRPSNGRLFLKNANASGFADIMLTYGLPGDKPVTGDWNGDGIDTIGVFRNGTFYLRNANSNGFADLAFSFGLASDLPVAGDWNGDGIDTIGVFRNGSFLLRNSNSSGTADLAFSLGVAGDIPIAGDWNGNDQDTTGIFRPSNGLLFLKNSNTSGFADISLTYGLPGDKPVTGDWDANGTDTIGVYRGTQFLLRNSNTNGFADLVFSLGIAGDVPISGDWDGLP